MTRDHTQLKIWKQAHTLTLKLYQITKQFPTSEKFGLTSQIRRASTSIGMNIAEGCGYDSPASTRRFFRISLGSIKEVEYQILLARDLEYISNKTYENILEEVQILGKMTHTFISNMPTTT